MNEALIGSLLERMDKVEGRLSIIEGMLDWGTSPLSVDEQAQQRAALQSISSNVTVQQALPVDAVVPVAMEPLLPLQASLESSRVVPPPLPPRVQGLKSLQSTISTMPAKSLARRESLEEWVGKNWTSWVGAIVVVLGVCFFLKYAWDAGWLAIAPSGRVWLAIGAAVAFAGVGEWIGRKGMRVLAATLSGAGVAMGMAACFAAATLFDVPVFSLNTAMIGVGICALAGIGLGLRMNAVTVAIIAMLGAYAAPAILSSGADRSVELMAYLGGVALIGWGLVYLKGGRWGVVRWVIWVCTCTWMTLWLLRYGLEARHSTLAIGATVFFFAGFVTEAYATLLREMKPFEDEDAQPEPAIVAQTQMLDGSLAILLMLSCAGAFAAIHAVLSPFAGGSGLLAMRPSAGVAIGMAVLHAMIALGSPGAQFGRSSWFCCAALVTLAVPLAFGQFAVTLGWLLLAAGLAVMARITGRLAIGAWSAVLFGLAVAKLFTLDLFNSRLWWVVMSADGQEVTWWMLLAWGNALIGHMVGWMLEGTHTPDASQPGFHRPRARMPGLARGLGIAMACAGTLVFLAGTVTGFRGNYLNLIVLAWTLGLILLAGQVRLGYRVQATALLIATTTYWATMEGIEQMYTQWHGAAQPPIPFLNLATLTGVLLLGLIAWMGRNVAEQSRSAAGVAFGLILFALLTFQSLTAMDWMAGSFADVGTAKFVALSILWGVLGLIAIVAGFWAQVGGLRYAGLGLLAVTLAKILILDLSTVRPVYRILSFLAVGGLLLCVSFVYHRHPALRKALVEKKDNAGETPAPQ